MRKIKISAGEVSATAQLFENPTADAIWNALPIEGTANTWGDEIYFAIPVDLDEAPDAQAIVDRGDLGYWPTGHAFCIFFGPTPMSRGDEVRAAGPVNVFGHVQAGAVVFKNVADGSGVLIEKLND